MHIRGGNLPHHREKKKGLEVVIDYSTWKMEHVVIRSHETRLGTDSQIRGRKSINQIRDQEYHTIDRSANCPLVHLSHSFGLAFDVQNSNRLIFFNSLIYILTAQA